MRRAIATLFTLGILSTFLLTVVLAIMLYVGWVSLHAAILGVVAINLVMLLISPTINDWIYAWFFGMEWITIEQLRERSPASAAVIEDVTHEYGYSQPKLGLIHDGNPTAFTYGSGRFNGRIIVSEGCFEYLDDNELSAVYAHELGHITSRDFITMTIANTIVEILYLIASRAFRVARRTASSSNQRANPGAAIALIGALAYVFYVISEYTVLYLSRVREYAADEFAADHTDPDYFSSALLKIAYGIVVSEDNEELARTTRNIGLMNLEMSKDKGAVFYTCKQLEEYDLLAQSLLFDIKSPWAKLSELTSTHPLTGKRIRNMTDHHNGTMFDFDAVLRRNPVNMRRMYWEFLRDLGVKWLPHFGVLGGTIAVGYLWYLGDGLTTLLFVPGVLLLGWGVGTLGKALYQFPRGDPKELTVLELLANPYASPIDGQPVRITGEIVGRGQAGYMFSEDLMLRGETGLIYLQYEHWLPVVGNYLFAFFNADSLLGKEATADGWFFRKTSPWVVLKQLRSEESTQTSYLHISSYLGAILLTLAGTVLIVVPAIGL